MGRDVSTLADYDRFALALVNLYGVGLVGLIGTAYSDGHLKTRRERTAVGYYTPAMYIQRPTFFMATYVYGCLFGTWTSRGRISRVGY